MNSIQVQKHTTLIKQQAKALGFEFCGVSRAEFLEEEAPRLETWLKEKMQGEMAYMANHFDKRLDPRLLVDGAKSVVSLLYNYFPKEDLAKKNEQGQGGEKESYKVSKYAYGRDYHYVIKDKLKALFEFIQENIGEVGGRVFVDSAPVMDKAWAQKSGLGWIGKHTNLLNRQIGSFFFIAELIIDLELTPDTPVKDYCGTCTRCIDACPTDAIAAPYVVDGSRCISYFTIELKEEIPTAMKGQFENWIFGCDICQDVCPWNRFSKPHQEPLFEPHPDLKNMRKQDWEEITEEVFRELFRKSAVKRTKLKGLKRNIRFISSPE